MMKIVRGAGQLIYLHNLQIIEERVMRMNEDTAALLVALIIGFVIASMIHGGKK